MGRKNAGLTGKPVYVVDGARTPFLKARGKPGAFHAADLAVAAGRVLLQRQPFQASDFDEVILGCVMPGPDEANIARIAALRLGCGEATPAFTVQRNCASGMQAIDTAAQNIASGRSDLVLAGGVEAMSHAPVLFNQPMVEWLADFYKAKSPRDKIKFLMRLRGKHLTPVIGLLRGLSDPIVGMSMGQTAEQLAYKFDIGRTEMDQFASESHRRLAQAQDNGYASETEVIYDNQGHHYKDDDGLRRDSDIVNLAKLKPVFDSHFGKVTAGNSAQVTDGAAWLILASEEAIDRHQLPVLGRIVDSQWAGLDPAQMGLGPAHAMAPLMTRHELNVDEVDYWEVNEAFAAQVLACVRAWEDPAYCKDQLGLAAPLGTIDSSRLNIDGGGISIGHPVGASGARIVLHLLHILKRKQAKRGIASLCIGGGQGGAMLVENVAR